jgi:hypothetical protein
VKQLGDIEFDSDDEIEELKNLKRMPGTVITEEKLKETLSKDTERLILDNHYWIKDSFIDKLGRMAPHLKHLSFRGINMASKAFMDCVCRLNYLQILDISLCKTL